MENRNLQLLFDGRCVGNVDSEWFCSQMEQWRAPSLENVVANPTLGHPMLTSSETVQSTSSNQPDQTGTIESILEVPKENIKLQVKNEIKLEESDELLSPDESDASDAELETEINLEYNSAELNSNMVSNDKKQTDGIPADNNESVVTPANGCGKTVNHPNTTVGTGIMQNLVKQEKVHSCNEMETKSQLISYNSAMPTCARVPGLQMSDKAEIVSGLVVTNSDVYKFRCQQSKVEKRGVGTNEQHSEDDPIGSTTLDATSHASTSSMVSVGYGFSVTVENKSLLESEKCQKLVTKMECGEENAQSSVTSIKKPALKCSIQFDHKKRRLNNSNPSFGPIPTATGEEMEIFEITQEQFQQFKEQLEKTFESMRPCARQRMAPAGFTSKAQSIAKSLQINVKLQPKSLLKILLYHGFKFRELGIGHLLMGNPNRSVYSKFV